MTKHTIPICTYLELRVGYEMWSLIEHREVTDAQDILIIRDNQA